MCLMQPELGLGPADLSLLWNIQVTMLHRHFGYFSGAQRRGWAGGINLNRQHLDG